MYGRNRVLYTAMDAVPGPKGASTHILYFLRALKDAGYELSAVTMSGSSATKSFELDGVRMLNVDGDGYSGFPERTKAFADRVFAEIDSRHFDVIHCRSLWDSYRITHTSWAGKLVFEVNGLPSVELKYHYPAIGQSDLPDRLRSQEIRVLERADAVICPSKVTASFLHGLGVGRKILHVIPNGVDPGLFYPSPKRLSPGKAKSGRGVAASPGSGFADENEADEETSKARPFDLLYVGTFVDWQGLDTLLNAISLIRDRSIRLTLVGRSSRHWRKSLTKQVQRLGLDGMVAIEAPLDYYSIPGLVRQSDICLVPLADCDRNVVQGCCPIKLLEYLACAKPVVAADLPVIREIVSGEEEALLFPPGDPEALASQIIRLLDDPILALRIGTAGRRRVLSQFTWQQAQAKLIELYRGFGQG